MLWYCVVSYVSLFLSLSPLLHEDIHTYLKSNILERLRTTFVLYRYVYFQIRHYARGAHSIIHYSWIPPLVIWISIYSKHTNCSRHEITTLRVVLWIDSISIYLLIIFSVILILHSPSDFLSVTFLHLRKDFILFSFYFFYFSSFLYHFR